MMFALAAFVLFVIATILCFVGNVDGLTIHGFIAAGLACLALSGVSVPEQFRR
jgi:hypothetical protein